MRAAATGWRGCYDTRSGKRVTANSGRSQPPSRRRSTALPGDDFGIEGFGVMAEPPAGVFLKEQLRGVDYPKRECGIRIWLGRTLERLWREVRSC